MKIDTAADDPWEHEARCRDVLQVRGARVLGREELQPKGKRITKLHQSGPDVSQLLFVREARISNLRRRPGALSEHIRLAHSTSGTVTTQVADTLEADCQHA